MPVHVYGKRQLKKKNEKQNRKLKIKLIKLNASLDLIKNYFHYRCFGTWMATPGLLNTGSRETRGKRDYRGPA